MIYEKKLKPNKSKKLTSLKVFPNPAKKQVVFSFNSDDHISEVYVIITDAVGEIVKREYYSESVNEYLWDTTDTSDGVYFYRIYSDKVHFKQQGKIVIQK